MNYEKLHKDTIAKLQEMVNSGKITVEIARGICADFIPENEDERIRKIQLEYWSALGGKDWYGVPVQKVISWLQKQGEHTNFINKIQIGDKVTRNEDGVLVNLSQLNRVAKKDEKQGEQNLIKHFCDCVHVGCHVNDCKRWCHSYQKEISYTNCNSNCNRYSKLMNYAFNIGETITDGISTLKIADIKDNYYIANDGERVEIYMAHRYYTTIQNLEAQKPAWSEEDEDTIKFLISHFCVSHCNRSFQFTSDKLITHGELLEKIRNLRPQSTWLPSDKHMKSTLSHH